MQGLGKILWVWLRKVKEAHLDESTMTKVPLTTVPFPVARINKKEG
jgi:hypothetical protein